MTDAFGETRFDTGSPESIGGSVPFAGAYTESMVTFGEGEPSLKEKISERVSSAVESSKAGLSHAAERICEGAASSAEALRSATSTAGRQVRSAASNLEGQIRRHPLTSLAIAFGVGVMVGKLIDAGRSRRW